MSTSNLLTKIDEDIKYIDEILVKFDKKANKVPISTLKIGQKFCKQGWIFKHYGIKFAEPTWHTYKSWGWYFNDIEVIPLGMIDEKVFNVWLYKELNDKFNAYYDYDEVRYSSDRLTNLKLKFEKWAIRERMGDLLNEANEV